MSRVTESMIKTRLESMNELVYGFNDDNPYDYYKDEHFEIQQSYGMTGIVISKKNSSAHNTLIHGTTKRECMEQMNAFMLGVKIKE